MIELIQSVGAAWGIGAVFAILLFFILMKVFKMMREDRKSMEDRLTNIIGSYDRTNKSNQRVMTKHSKVLTELITFLKNKNGSK